MKYREEYDKFKALYTIPRGVQDDPNTARCLRVGKLNIDVRYFKKSYIMKHFLLLQMMRSQAQKLQALIPLDLETDLLCQDILGQPRLICVILL